MTFRPPIYTVRREQDPFGISSKSQDFYRDLLTTTLAPPIVRAAPVVAPRTLPEPPGPARFWSQTLVLTTLRGQDARLVGAQLYDRPPLGPQPPTQSYTQSLFPGLIVNPPPYPGLTGPPWGWIPAYQPDRFWSQNLVLSTLRGQDARLTGVQYFDRPPLGPQQPDRFWSQTLVTSTLAGQDFRITSARLYDLPVRPLQPDRSYVQSLFPGLLVVNFPPNPGLTGPAWGWTPVTQPDRFWSQNLVVNTLAGQDARLIGTQLSSPPWGWTPAYQPDRTWSYSYNLNLIGQDARLPGQYYIWDLPQVAKQPDRSFVQGMIRFPTIFLTLATQAWLWVPQAATLIQQQFIFPPLKAWIWQPLAGVMTIFRPGWIWRAARGMGILKGGNLAQSGSPFLGGQARIDTIGNVEGQIGRSPNEC